MLRPALRPGLVLARERTRRSPQTARALPGYLQGWMLDQADRTLTVYRHTPDGYLVALRATAHERVRAEPFDAIEIAVAVLFGEYPDEST